MSFRVKVEPLNNLDRGNGNGRLLVLYAVNPSTGHKKARRDEFGGALLAVKVEPELRRGRARS